METTEKERAEAIKKHRRIRRILRIVGPILVAAGLGLAIMGFVDMFLSTAEGKSPSLFWGLIAGLPVLGIGGMLCLAGFRKETIRYTVTDPASVLHEAEQTLAPAGAATKKDAELCPHCGKPNEVDAKFCRHCGSAFFVTCPHCGENVKDGDFCGKCGAPLH